jgi:hypothetical protein
VIVRVNDALHETAKAQLEEIARTRGFDGRLVVVAEPEIAIGDCRIMGRWRRGPRHGRDGTEHRRGRRTLSRRTEIGRAA